MTKADEVERMHTGVRNLDDLLHGGLPMGSVTVVAGPPGAGKTILTQQICFHNASPERPVLYFNTLSEPTAKTLRYLSQFAYFDASKIDNGVQFVDLGNMLRTKGLEESFKAIVERVKAVRPGIVVVDSFKVFDDLAKSQVELRRFGYDLAVHLMAWETTTFLLGEFHPRDIETNPLFSIVDGLIEILQREQSGEQQRFLQIVKMRGTNHSRDQHSFVIMDTGVEVYAPRVTIQRESRQRKTERLMTGIGKLDALLDGGIPLGSTLLIAGVAGTGKTVLSFEFLYRGAEAGEKGIMFSFEETRERLLATARGLGWDIERHIERGMLDIVFIPQPDIMVEANLLMMREKIEAMQARRVVVDSVSVFLHKVRDPQVAREKTFQIASIVQNAGAVAFLNTDIPYGSNQISRFGVEETVVEGVILLTATQEGLERQRYLEIYKLRNTAHLKGRHSITIGPGGLTVFPRYESEADLAAPPPPVELGRRLPSGVPGLDELLGGGLLERSVTLLSGSAGIGKSTMAMQFIVEGARHGEPGLFVALEEGPAQIVRTADALGLPLEKAVDDGVVEILYLPRERVRPSQLLSLLADRVEALEARRFVLDSVSHLANEGLSDEELRQLLYALSVRFKSLGVTTLFTLESTSMYSSERITERRFSPLADNLVAMRYARLPGEIRPLLTIAKTRGSEHDFGLYYFSVGQGGVRIEERAEGPKPLRKTKSKTARKRTKPRSP
ncbi:MAG TPA: ATPase domain-containing protein [Woeseiaceae bacterium]|nr:ATPase domain-containing protein [Woeseiaceae bacterium]